MEPHPRYQILEKIASGSFASVYRAQDVELGREVAIKQIHAQYLEDPQQLLRYWQEAQLLASFQHPNIVTIYDLVRDRGWLIMELMQGDLSKLAGRRPMELNSLRTALAHCLRALKFLHSHGIVHGDIKPSNMMIDRRRRVKLGDFGLARRVSDDEGSLIKGTTKYMAPEVVSDDMGEVGPASDLYSLGFAAYELMCGENFEDLFPGLSAFGRDRQMAWMMWHAAPDRRLPEIHRVLDNVPEDLARTVQKLTAKPQSERYRSADEALADLKIDLKLVKSAEDSADRLERPKIDSQHKRRLLIVGAFAFSLVVSLAMLFLPQGGTSNPAPAEKPLAGIVRSVQLDSSTLVITNEDGAKSIVVGPEPRIRLEGEDRQYILLSELLPEDRVTVAFKPAAVGSAPRCEIAVRRPVTSTGRLKEVDPAGRRIVVSIAADPNPQDVPMAVPEEASLFLNGTAVEGPGALRADDRVEVTHVYDPRASDPRAVIRLEARRSVAATGFVSAITSRENAFWLTLDVLGLTQNLPFAGNCQILIEGKINPEAPFTPRDLKPDDRVAITYDTHVTSVEAWRRPRQAGALMSLEPAARELTVRSNDGTMVTYQLGSECAILLEGKPVELADLQRHDRVDITYAPREGGPPLARTIDARRPR